MKKNDKPTLITPKVLKRIPLPLPGEDGDKEDRGRVLVIGGNSEMPGAVILAATAAMRAGAGKLQIATAASVATLVGACMPEALVFALPETKAGALAASAVAKLEKHLGETQAVCVGPGMMSDEAVNRFVKGVLRHCRGVNVVLDAGAIACLAGNADSVHALDGRAVITPNQGEMAGLCDEDKSAIERDPLRFARRAAEELGAVVALKGRETFIASPGGEVYLNRAGNVGLATSGSGDVLSGLVAGLIARGAQPLVAAAWGVYLHARAGDRLAERIGLFGFLARELPAEIPALMSELSQTRKR
ncbi:MAG: NAD(P)H-hydrate dehydratase [Acidobacteria bacterium]|nr:NAD(P)H-hydrate dehydratase [Acidobacteriota bacterium]